MVVQNPYGDKAYRPSRIFSKEKSSELTNKNYPFSKKIYRLQYESQIKFLFDNGYDGKSNQYYGKISGIPVRIDFSLNSSSVLRAKTEEDLDTTYRKVLDALSGR